MYGIVLNKLTVDFGKYTFQNVFRYGHTLRGKPAGVARTLAQRLQEERVVDPEIAWQVDIGFPQLRKSRSEQMKERLAHIKAQRSNKQLEKLAREHKLEIDLEQVKKDSIGSSGQFFVRDIAKYYSVYQHLFGDAFFVPRVPLNIQFSATTNDLSIPVYYGNLIKPNEAKTEPMVSFDPSTLPTNLNDSNSLWTLIMTNPDGHLTENNKEYVHWLITNIPSNQDVKKGDVIVPYLQPFPAKGTGYHRHIFILYKQEKKLDLNNYAVKKQFDLSARTFSTLDFYRKYQDDLTPAGLAFFQSDWDSTLTDFYHNCLELKEPIYEYDFPKQYIKDQKWFPLREPFNLYMDKYRDQKQVNKEFLERKLAKTHPFDGPKAPLQYPNAHSIKNVPSWLKTEMVKSRLGWGRINDV